MPPIPTIILLQDAIMSEAEKTAEPPSCLQPLIFLIGKDRCGHWVAREQSGVCGGLFTSRADALKFARSENRARTPVVVLVSATVELDMSGRQALPPHAEYMAESLQRHVA
jgi:hypothetical protein